MSWKLLSLLLLSHLKLTWKYIIVRIDNYWKNKWGEKKKKRMIFCLSTFIQRHSLFLLKYLLQYAIDILMNGPKHKLVLLVLWVSIMNDLNFTSILWREVVGSCFNGPSILDHMGTSLVDSHIGLSWSRFLLIRTKRDHEKTPWFFYSGMSFH